MTEEEIKEAEKGVVAWKGFVKGEDGKLWAPQIAGKCYVLGQRYDLPPGVLPRMCSVGYHFCTHPLRLLEYCSPGQTNAVYGRVRVFPPFNKDKDQAYGKCAAASIEINDDPLPIDKFIAEIDYTGAVPRISREEQDGAKEEFAITSFDCVLHRIVEGGLGCCARGICDVVYIMFSKLGFLENKGSVGVVSNYYSVALTEKPASLVAATSTSSLAMSRETADHSVAVALCRGSAAIVKAHAAVAVSAGYAEACTGSVAVAWSDGKANEDAVAMGVGHYSNTYAAGGGTASAFIDRNSGYSDSGTVHGELGATLQLGFMYFGVMCWYTLFVDGAAIKPHQHYRVNTKGQLLEVQGGVQHVVRGVKPYPTTQMVDKFIEEKEYRRQ